MCNLSELHGCFYAEKRLEYTALLGSRWPRLLEQTTTFTTVTANLSKMIKRIVKIVKGPAEKDCPAGRVFRPNQHRSLETVAVSLWQNGHKENENILFVSKMVRFSINRKTRSSSLTSSENKHPFCRPLCCFCLCVTWGKFSLKFLSEDRCPCEKDHLKTPQGQMCCEVYFSLQ